MLSATATSRQRSTISLGCAPAQTAEALIGLPASLHGLLPPPLISSSATAPREQSTCHALLYSWTSTRFHCRRPPAPRRWASCDHLAFGRADTSTSRSSTSFSSSPRTTPSPTSPPASTSPPSAHSLARCPPGRGSTRTCDRRGGCRATCGRGTTTARVGSRPRRRRRSAGSVPISLRDSLRASSARPVSRDTWW